MIFPVIDASSVVLVDEKIRISASNSYVTKDDDAITKVEIEIHTGEGLVDVTGTTSADWYYDFAYSTDGEKTASVVVTTTTDPDVTATVEKAITVLAVADAALFSNDDDLKIMENDIMKWLPEGKFTWNFVHFRIQENILTEIKKKRIINSDGTDILKTQILDVKEVREWAVYSALAMIFNGISNAVDDVFSRKSAKYSELASKAQNLAFGMLSIDFNKDSAITEGERLDMLSGTLIRR